MLSTQTYGNMVVMVRLSRKSKMIEIHKQKDLLRDTRDKDGGGYDSTYKKKPEGT